MDKQQILFLVSKIIVIIGALNWGAVSAFNTDLVPLIVGLKFDRYVKMLVGVAGIVTAYSMYLYYKKSQEQKEQIPVEAFTY